MKTTLIKFLQTEMNWNPINISFIEKLGGLSSENYKVSYNNNDYFVKICIADYLHTDSLAICEQIITISKGQIKECLGYIDKDDIVQIEKRLAIRDIIRTLCAWKGVEIIEGEICPDHVHLMLSIPPKMSISSFMGYLNGKSSLMIFQKFGNMKFAYRNREFWCKGYYVDTVGKNTKAIKEYIAHQLKVDKESDQLSLFDPRDPFTGSK